jgi:long-chain fatty acid transport protein
VKTNVLALSIASALSLAFAPRAQGAAFQLVEQGVGGLGNAYAGAAAVAEDASTVWWNPAGMARLLSGKHILLGGHVVIPSTEFTSNGSVPAAASNPALVGNGGDPSTNAFLPNLFFAMDLNPTWSIGLGISVPFGLKTEYDSDFVGRFQGLSSELKTWNVNPSVSFKLSKTASLGFGLSYQRAEIELISAVNYSGIAFGAGGAGLLAAVGGPGVEGRNTTNLDGDAWGFNVGALFDVTPATRVGVHYRSALDYETDGNTSFTSVPAAFAGIPALAAGTSNGDVKLEFDAPATFSISAAHRASEALELLFDATWTEWSRVQQVLLVRTSGPANGQTLDTLPFNFDDAWRLAIGANYKWSGAWTLRVGVAYDQTPVPNAQARTVRLPDEDRYWFALGATYQPSKASRFDVGYTFIQISDADIDNDQTARARGIVRGTYEAYVNILSVQYQHSF